VTRKPAIPASVTGSPATSTVRHDRSAPVDISDHPVTAKKAMNTAITPCAISIPSSPR
jgi:hypothetical protein